MHKSKFKPMLEYTILYALGIRKRLNIGQESDIYKKYKIIYNTGNIEQKYCVVKFNLFL